MCRQYVQLHKVALSMILTAMWLLALASGPVQALQEPPAVKALLDLLRLELQLEPKVGNIRTDGDAIVLEDVLLAEVRKDGQTTFSAKAQEIRLTGTSHGDDGIVFFKRIDVNALALLLAAQQEKSPLRVMVPRMTFVEASLLPRAHANTPQEEFAATWLLATMTDVPEIRLEFPGVRPIVWGGLKGTWKGDRRTGAGETWMNLGTLPLPLMELAALDADNASKLQAELEALGLQQITLQGELRSKVVWTPDQRMKNSFQLRYGAPEAGELTLNVRDMAMPLELLQQGRRMARGMADAPSGAAPAPQDKTGVPGMGQKNPLNDPQLAISMRRLTLGGLDLIWRDHGLTRRMLQWEAGRAGLDVSELVARRLEDTRRVFSAILPPEIAMSYLRELSRFLQEPKSFRISFSGVNDQPIALANAAMFLLMPQMMLNTVKLEVKANDVP